MKFSILVSVTLLVASVAAFDFKLTSEDALIDLILEKPHVFLDDRVGTEHFEATLRSLLEGHDEVEHSVAVDGSVVSNLTVTDTESITKKLVTSNGTSSSLVSRKGEAHVTAKCSRHGIIDSARLSGTCSRSTSSSLGKVSESVTERVEFDAEVVVVRLGHRRHSEVLQVAKEYNLIEEVEELTKQNGGKCPSISLVTFRSCANETATCSRGSIDLKRSLTGALTVARLPGLALNVAGKVTRVIRRRNASCENSVDLEFCHPLVITRRVNLSVIV